MITPTLQSAATQFLSYFLQPLRLQSGGGPLSPEELAQNVTNLGDALEITIGEYKPFAGSVPECSGITVPVNDAIFVNHGLVEVTPGGPDGITLTHQARESLPYANKYAMCWLVERADIKIDGRDTIARILADLRDPVTTSGPAPVAPPGPEQPSTRAGVIADAIVAIEDRANYPTVVSEVSEVPAGIDLTLPLYQELLRDFFTYDSNNDYYAKWSGATEGAFPAEATDEYKRLNVQSTGIVSDNVLVLGHVPSDFGLPGHADRDAREFREFIVEIMPRDGSGELGFDVINSAVKVVSIDGAPVRDYFDFCFFTVS